VTESAALVDEILNRIVRELQKGAPEQLYETLVAARYAVARSMESFDAGATISSRFPTPADLAAALEARDPTVIAFAPYMLALVDRPAALALALALVKVPVPAAQSKVEIHARRAAYRAIGESADVLPLDDILEMAFAEVFVDSTAIIQALLARPEVAHAAGRYAILKRLGDTPDEVSSFRGEFRDTLLALQIAEKDAATLAHLHAIWLKEEHPYRTQALQWLFRAGHEGLAPIAAKLPGLLLDHAAPAYQRHDALNATFMLGDADAAANVLLPRLGSMDDVGITTQDVLRHLGFALAGNRFPRADPRWVEAVVGLSADPALSAAAKEVLGRMDKAAVKKATAAAAKGAKAPAKKKAEEKTATAKAPAAKTDYLARYLAGEHEKVWDELRALGEGVRAEGVVEQAQEVAREMMRRLQKNVEIIAAALEKGRYNFAAKKPVVLARVDAPKKITALEKTLGGPIPLALAAFYEVFESVSLAEDPEGMTDAYTIDPELGRSDPLVIVSLAILAKDLAEQANSASRCAYVAPDWLTKYDVNDEYPDEHPARMLVPDAGADAKLDTQQGPPIFFVDYLRAYVQRGGFYRLDAAKNQNEIATLTPGVVPF
jgi:hypothetical protein